MFSGRALRRGLSWTATLCFALSFGLNFGKSNHASYLLASQRLLEPGLWARDFQVNTQHYHPLYARLGAVLLKLDSSGWLIGLANVLAVCVGMWCVSGVLRTLLAASRDERAENAEQDEQACFVAYMLVLSLAAVSSTGSVGGSYVFSDTFQPSTLGSLGLLGAALYLLRGRPLQSGLWLAGAAAFHLNYALLALPVFGVGWLLGERERPLRSAFIGLAPVIPIVLWFLPVFAASSAGSPEQLLEARRIFQDVRAPHHFHVATFATSFVPWLGFQLLGASVLWHAARLGPGAERRLLGLLSGFVVLITSAALLSSVGSLRAVDSLFAWRLAPHANLLAQAAFACAVARALQPTALPAQQPRTWHPFGPEPLSRALAGLGALCLLVAAILGQLRGSALICLIVGALPLLHARLLRDATSHLQARWQAALGAAFTLLFLGSAAGPLSKLDETSDLLAGKDRDLAALCSWVKQNTPQSSLLLTPPDEEGVRFRCQRAIVVDWKTTPVVPSEVMEWAKRIEDVTGRHPLRGEADMAGYAELDAARLRSLRQRYAPDYVLLERGAAFTPSGAPVFAAGRFRLYQLPREPAADSARATAPGM